MVIQRETAGELSSKALKDTTKYDAIEIGHDLDDDIPNHVRKAINNHYNLINESEFCVVMVIASDPIIKNLMRRKFYCWPYLPSPRPNQSVWLFRKSNDSINRLWVLPSAQVMAELSSMGHVHEKYRTMQAWSIAFFKGTFWEYIRFEHDINMLSEQEYLAKHREELIKAGCKPLTSDFSDPFDFTKVEIKKVVDTIQPISDQDAL